MAHERAVLAGGCFWGMQDLIRKLPGVENTRVGYTGGNVPNATYRNHGTHAEGIEILFDPETISYRRILEYFFQIHDPTTHNRQAPNGSSSGSSHSVGIYTPASRAASSTVLPSRTCTSLKSIVTVRSVIVCLNVYSTSTASNLQTWRQVSQRVQRFGSITWSSRRAPACASREAPCQ